MKISRESLKELLDYNPDTGFFTWKKTVNRSALAGQKAGTVNSNGHIAIKISRRAYLAHQLAWLYMTGGWPAHEIDHMNVNGSDNRWCNLRQCTRTENEMNKGIRSDNTSGYKGVSWNKRAKKWMTKVKLNNKCVFSGYFDDIELADLAAREARDKYHGKFSRHE
ncbi:HNH endonuclease [Xenorhabdus khoisanae]|uniref:HNH endonuclease n=1 Tax=Xenorhabdus khoisanae TaxID=880157 RepID=UPI0032B839D1